MAQHPPERPSGEPFSRPAPPHDWNASGSSAPPPPPGGAGAPPQPGPWAYSQTGYGPPPTSGAFGPNSAYPQWDPPPASPPAGPRVPWRWIALGAGVALAAVVVLLVLPVTASQTVDQADWARKIGQAMTEQVGQRVTVTCPEGQPIRQGYIFDCVASDGAEKRIVRVTQDDDQGHFTWQLTQQQPG